MRRWVGLAALMVLLLCGSAGWAQKVPVDPAVVGKWKKEVSRGVVQWWIIGEKGDVLVYNETHGRPGPAGRGAISAADGVYTLHIGGHDVGGTYSFMSDGRMVLKSRHGSATWERGIPGNVPAVASDHPPPAGKTVASSNRKGQSGKTADAKTKQKGEIFNPLAIIAQAFGGKQKGSEKTPPAARKAAAAPQKSTGGFNLLRIFGLDKVKVAGLTLDTQTLMTRPMSAFADAAGQKLGASLHLPGNFFKSPETLVGLVLINEMLKQVAAPHGQPQTPEEKALRKCERLLEQGHYRDAIPIAERLLADFQSKPKPDEDLILKMVGLLAQLYQGSAQYAKARDQYQRLYAAYSKKLGPTDPQTAWALSEISRASTALGDYTYAQKICGDAVDLLQKRLEQDKAKAKPRPAPPPTKKGAPAPKPPPDPVVLDNLYLADALQNLARVYVETEDYQKAVAMFERARGIFAGYHDAPDEANTMADLAESQRLAGDYGKAEELCSRALEMLTKAKGPDHPETAACKIRLADVFRDRGLYARAEPLYHEAFAAYQKNIGEDSSPAANALVGLGSFYQAVGDYHRAEDDYQRSLRIYTAGLGPDHPTTAAAVLNLADLAAARGDDAQAQGGYEKARAALEKVYGKGHLKTAPALDGLGRLYLQIGDDAKAEPLLQSVLGIRENGYGRGHPRVAATLVDLAACASDQQHYAQAEPLLQRALAINQKAFGDRTMPVGNVQRALALLYVKMRRNDRAEALLDGALKAAEHSRLGDKPAAARILTDRAELFWSEDRLDRAEDDLRRAIRIYERTLGADHPFTAEAQEAYAYLLLDQGHVERGKVDPDRRRDALELALKVSAVRERILGNVLSFTSERQRLAYEAKNDPYSLLATLAGSGREAAAVDNAIAQTILRNKGIVLDSLLEDRNRANASSDPAVRKQLDALASAKERLSQMLISVPKNNDEEAIQARDAERARLQKQVEDMEASLARGASAEGTRKSLSVTVPEVQHALPADAALVEFLRYRRYLGQTRFEPAYGAVVLSEARGPVWVPLGAAKRLDDAVHHYQVAVRGGPVVAVGRSAIVGRVSAAPTGSDAPAADGGEALFRGLYDLAWAPVDHALPPGRHTVVLCPDGALNFVSFATLMAPGHDDFLAEKYRVRYVASGRDLVKPVAAASGKPVMIMFGNPDFNADLSLRSEHTKLARHAKAKHPAVYAQGGRRHGRHPLALHARPEHHAAPQQVAMAGLADASVRGVEGVHFDPLPGTQQECSGLKQVALAAGWGVNFFGKAQATRQNLLEVKGPYVLHLATHGFFLPESVLDDPVKGLVDEEGTTHRRFENPMDRSGLALAGANPTIAAWIKGGSVPPDRDGIVKAEDVGGLHLNGTWLVTLSACDTGSGEERSGEGVMGLRRGFIQAGTENLLITLWPVADRETAEIMEAFYAEAHQTGDAPAALADVQKDWLVKLKRRGVLEAVRVAGPFIMSSQGRF